MHIVHRLFIVVFVQSIFFTVNAQDLPKDFLSKAFHKERRARLRDQLPKNSVAVFFSNAVRNRSNDVNYVYHQDPDFFYFTGFREPHAVLLIFKDNQLSTEGASYNEILFIQPRDKQAELWSGRRMGPQRAKELLGISEVFNNADFKNYNIDFSTFDEVLFYDFSNDVRNSPNNAVTLYKLIEWFKKKAGYPERGFIKVDLEKKKNNLNTTDLLTYMHGLRGIKTEEELKMIRRAVQISCQGQIEVMRAMKPEISEREIQGIHEFVFKKYQAENVGYPSIVGAGNNGCILHYIENYKPQISSKEMILMDLGAEYHGYTADITRTIPVNGKFTEEQKAIYNIVLEAQEAAMKICKEGATFKQLNQATRDAVGAGLKKLGIISDQDQTRMYYPHGCCHHLGLDVHDKGFKGKLQENMVFTIEPGIYIPDQSKCDKRWWGIAVRIEDDFRATKNACEHLSAMLPRSVETIEALMRQHSPLNKFVLPDLK